MSGAAAGCAAAVAVLAAVALPTPSVDSDAAVDLRSRLLLDLDCSSRLGRTRTSLFANGTARYREWVDEEERMLLMELDRERLDGYVERLARIDLGEVESPRYGASGEWVEQCRLLLAPGSGPERSYRFNRYDSLPLGLSRLVKIADELQRAVEREATRASFPPGWEPRSGDVLERRDGVLFEVIAYTADGKGVELHGVEQPLVLYVPVDDIVGQFVGLAGGDEADGNREEP